MTQGCLAPNFRTTAEAAGERRYLTVMFCDLVGSSSISARLDAEEWRDLVGAFFDAGDVTSRQNTGLTFAPIL
jgi:class 3 adenylate cyclase